MLHDGRLFDWIHESIMNRLLSFAGFDKNNFIDRSATRGIRGALNILRTIGTAPEFGLREKIEFNKRWYELLSVYTDGELTYPTDKLIAVSGVARLIQNSAKTPYTAGIWSSIVPELGLLWRARIPKEKQSQYCAPSWSWAAVDGRVDLFPSLDFADARLHVENITFETKIERIAVSYDGQSTNDATSLVDMGHLDATGPVANVCSLKSGNRCILRLTEKGSDEATSLAFFPDWEVDLASSASPSSNSDARKGSEDGQLVAVRVMSIRYSMSHVQIYGLVLCIKSTTNDVTTAERVGAFNSTEFRVDGVLPTVQWPQRALRII